MINYVSNTSWLFYADFMLKRIMKYIMTQLKKRISLHRLYETRINDKNNEYWERLNNGKQLKSIRQYVDNEISASDKEKQQSKCSWLIDWILAVFWGGEIVLFCKKPLDLVTGKSYSYTTSHLYTTIEY